MSSQFDNYDVFISHAIEDKIAVGNELCEKLKACGLKVLFSGSEMRYGDSIEDVMKKGFSRSWCGIILFTRNYLSKIPNPADLNISIRLHQERNHLLFPVIVGSVEFPWNISNPYHINPQFKSASEIDKLVEYLVKTIKKEEKEVSRA